MNRHWGLAIVFLVAAALGHVARAQDRKAVPGATVKQVQVKGLSTSFREAAGNAIDMIGRLEDVELHENEVVYQAALQGALPAASRVWRIAQNADERALAKRIYQSYIRVVMHRAISVIAGNASHQESKELQKEHRDERNALLRALGFNDETPL